MRRRTEGQKKRRNKNIVIAFMVVFLMTWVSSSSMFFTSANGGHEPGDHNKQSLAPKVDSKQGSENVDEAMMVGEEETCKELSTLGSRPPNCEHKCKGCIPCEAIQVPTTSDHLGIQFANYEPEGWKCKCGGSFFNP